MKLLKPMFLVCFALFLTLGFYAALSYFERQKPPPAPIKAIAQMGPLKDALKTDYLAEFLGLSVDFPRSITAEEAEKILLEIPCIKKVAVSFLNPETLYIDYTLRTPQFILGDFENLALDKHGAVFSLTPYYTPKRLPVLYLGEGHVKEKKEVATHLLEVLGSEITMIDVSNYLERSLGKREIVIAFGAHLLRLTPKRYLEEIAHYQKIRMKMGNDPFIIDLRVPSLAYITSIVTEPSAEDSWVLLNGQWHPVEYD
ncbi:hypothetical protein [Candidatus Neptunichlamydia sp. REUL1]|uniref:hypothetical protein n=1 Tax=Candidatus Neptunichlamydia sp. REUL1 TaxID=3064277 RepID=UPI002930C48C|nr:hypothetical protein [Candidatus Neptunochlamydia sp. REUL1]